MRRDRLAQAKGLKRAVQAALAVWLVVSAGALAQDPVFQGGVSLIRLDVSVLDDEGQPVRDLAIADFQVTEEGRPLQIRGFQAVDVLQPAPPLALTEPPLAMPGDPASAAATVSSTSTLADVSPGRLIVMVMDDDMTPADPKWGTQARDIARAIVDGLAPDDRMAVQFTRVSETRLELTTDRSQLLSEIDRFIPGGFFALPPTETGDDEVPRYRRTMSALDYTVEALAGVTDRQKMIVYVGPGIPVNQMLTGTTVDSGRPWHDDFLRYMTALFREAERANVVVYTFDPTGLDGLERYAYDRIFLAARMKSTLSGPPPLATTIGGMQARAANIARWTTDFAVSVAENTGGRAFIRSDNFEPAVDRMLTETSFYYLIAVEPLEPTPDGRFHEVEIHVDRPDVDVRGRRGYYYD